MTEIHRLAGEPRTRTGKGAARADRRNGRVPAIVYGASKDPASITLPENEVKRELNSSDALYAQLRNRNFGDMGPLLQKLSRDVQEGQLARLVHPHLPIHQPCLACAASRRGRRSGTRRTR